MNISDVVIVSTANRGLHLATRLAESGHRVSLIELQSDDSRSSALECDLLGPFRRFIATENDPSSSDASLRDWQSSFEVLTSSGPIALSGVWAKSGETHLAALSSHSQERFHALMGDLFSLSRGRERIALRSSQYESRSIASRKLKSQAELLEIRTQLARQAEAMGVRLIDASKILGVQMRARAIDRISVEAKRGRRGDGATVSKNEPTTERSRLFVWMLSRAETQAYSGSTALFESLFSKGHPDPLLYWWRNRLLWRTNRRVRLPVTFAVVTDLFRPLSHQNLLVCDVIEASQSISAGSEARGPAEEVQMDIWSLLPSWSAIDAAYRDEHRVLAMSVLSSQFIANGAKSMQWMSPSPLALSSPNLEVIHSVEGSFSKPPEAQLTNLICFTPESLNWVGALGFDLQCEFVRQMVQSELERLSYRAVLQSGAREVEA